PLSWMHAREERLLAAEEQRLAYLADSTLLVSDEEAALLRSRLADPARADVRGLGNGIDADFFDPAGVEAEPELAGPGPHFVFTGQMDYPPNVA
ncbi:MAG: glycosyl transferase family 1, partial [Novosphingobium meiothermophilum]